MNSETSGKESKALAEHFFRLEYAKIVAVITPYFGLSKIDLAEDIVQDTLLEAIHTWEYKGIPDNPAAWLYTVAKNKALNSLKRIEIEKKYIESTTYPLLTSETTFSEEQIADDQLRMMFACCNPAISQDAQISLILKTLCGLSIGEIANAFVTSNETINKRLVRARKVLKDIQAPFEIPNDQVLEERLIAVHKTVFLLFNEGYSTSKGDQLINYELCLEAIRLTELISNHPKFASHSSPHALLALMLLNASRFKARMADDGAIIRMVDQDRSLWDQRLIGLGLQHLGKIPDHNEVSIYHILATISAYHCTSKNYESTNWEGILKMYDVLISIDNSSLVRLNRAIALAKVEGAKAGIKELLNIEKTIPPAYHLFHTTLAELYMETEQFDIAIIWFQEALKLKVSNKEKQLITNRIEVCSQGLK
ncbi:RNA polymerase sigma factor [Roseivirga sp. E12]|uniref:RNA polymerase sigma factor n=1 Tax=Roseivirga sp. E12 TaxID=2819237 RepID=UPI001ABD1E75|nr:sigma-70 family RNA polymerase sigma factor [Roseivirga sp. E12]MBO3697616.1 sigma-70 family RNA polymerase sigma factor [Roseivirga sp. E12]